MPPDGYDVKGLGAKAYASAKEQFQSMAKASTWAQQAEENDKMVHKIEDLDTRLTQLKTAVEPFLELVEVLEARVTELEEEIDRMNGV